MYSLAIYIYMLCVNLASLFNKKARLLLKGHRNTWNILREKIQKDYQYLWFHAASLGEFEQGRPLMEQVKREHPDKKILLTFFSPSGYEVEKNYKVADVVCYLPFDTPLNARKFIRLAHPEKVFFIKYEFWRNYIDVLYKKKIPVYSVSSIFREKQIFFRWYGLGYARVLRRFTHLFVQNSKSYALLKGIGVNSVSVVGDTRFARVIDIMKAAQPLPIAQSFAENRTLLIAGSTWQPDEDVLINYFNAHSNVFLVLAPHVVNENHLREIERKLTRPFVRYSQTNAREVRKANCLIIDCYKLLSSIYRYATIAYVGGGFGVGIHNVPEAAVYGVPVIIGPNNKKFREAQELLENGGCLEVHDLESFTNTINYLLTNQSELMKSGEASKTYIKRNSNAARLVYKATLS